MTHAYTAFRRLALGFAVVPVAFCATMSSLAAQQATPAWEVSERHGKIDLYSESSLDRDLVFRQLDAVESELHGLLNIPAANAPIQIILFDSRTTYLKYLAERLPEARSRRALFYQNGDTSQIYAIRSAALVTDLRHEFTHVLLHQHLAFLPLWLDEGLAEYFEIEPSRRLRMDRVTSIRWKLRLGWRVPLNDLESLRQPLDMTGEDYAHSWATVCFLINASPTTRQILQDYLATISRGEAPGRFSRFSAERLPNFDSDFSTFFRRPEIRLNLARQN